MKDLSFLYVENIIKLLSREEAINEHAVKNVEGKVFVEIMS